MANISTTFNQLCEGSGCIAASQAVQTNSRCFAAINSTMNIDVICSGTCNSLLTNFVNRCRSVQVTYVSTCCIQEIIKIVLTIQGFDVADTEVILSTLCGNPACGAASNALFSNLNCSTALDNDDSSTLCFGTCRNLFDSFLTACPVSLTVCSGCVYVYAQP